MKKFTVHLICLVILIFVLQGYLLAQGSSAIYLIKIKSENDNLTYDKPIRITEREGYNNQPSFCPEGLRLYYSSDVKGQAEIFAYEISSGTSHQVTSTAESEYSPLIMPDGHRFSVIQLIMSEGPRKGAQPLVAFTIDGKGAQLIYEKGKKVGYHAWIDKNQVAMFILGNPHFLQIVNLEKDIEIKAAENIGRSLYKIPGQNAISFSQKNESGQETIKSFDLNAQKISEIAIMKSGNDFYAWTPSGKLIMGVESKLFIFHPGQDQNWQEAADFKDFGLHKITRLTVGPKGQWLAVVDNY